MNPALSVIAFTTLSGAGYGLWAWLALVVLRDPQAAHAPVVACGALLGFALVAVGLSSSTFHLGKPLRAWRAFSQWRTSWLSREGVLAMASIAAFLAAVAVAVSAPRHAAAVQALATLLASLSLATVACTAMIYASLRTIPAWNHRLVPPLYLGFALQTGGLPALALLSHAQHVPRLALALAIAGSGLLWALKARYWRDIDAQPLPATRATALGLPPGRAAAVFEAPHTEASYLTREMAFVLARRHARRLRTAAAVLSAMVPALCLLAAILVRTQAPWLWIATVAALAGAFVERWLFFAQARHVVTLYY